MIDDALRKEIESKIGKIKGNPASYDQRRELVKESLRSSGDIYSFWIENPDLRANLLLENRKPETVKKIARKGIQAVHNAWYFLSRIGEHGGFAEALDENVVLSVNSLINGNNKRSGAFRLKDVTLNFPDYTPPSWENVPGLTREAIQKVKQDYVDNPLESAIYAHLALALIQPFREGNKRTARLIQDRLLWDACLPPVIIPAGEGRFYLDLLERTSVPYREGNDGGQGQFYDYIASKVNNGLDDILNDLDVH